MPERHAFPVWPLNRFARTGAAIKRPTEITHFSYTANVPFPSNAPPVSNLRRPKDASNGNNTTDLETARINISHSRVREIHYDSRGIKYYYTPEIGASLSDGFDEFQQVNDGDDEHLDGLLASLTHLEQELKVNGKQEGGPGLEIPNAGTPSSPDEEYWKTKTDIITWRGLITKIMLAPYNNFDGFEMNATLFEDTIFLEESHEFKLADRVGQYSKRPRPGQASQEMMTFWGHKFETLSLLPRPWDDASRDYIESRPQHYVNNYEQYISVVRTGIGDLRLVLGGEVDAVWDCLPIPPSTSQPNYVELKTAADHELIEPSTIFASHPHHRIPGTDQPCMLNALSAPHPYANPDANTSPQQRMALERFDRKLLKFWIQSFLLGIPKIIVGFRTNDERGILTRVQEYNTTALPHLVADRAISEGRRPPWEKEVCINFAGEFLTFLRDTIVKYSKYSSANGASQGAVWKVRRKERSDVVEVFQVEESGYGDILSREFVAWRRTGDPLAAAREGALERLRSSVWN